MPNQNKSFIHKKAEACTQFIEYETKFGNAQLSWMGLK